MEKIYIKPEKLIIRIIENIELNKLSKPISTFYINFNIAEYPREQKKENSFNHYNLFENENLFFKCESEFKKFQKDIKKIYGIKIDLDLDEINDLYEEESDYPCFISFMWDNILKNSDTSYSKNTIDFISKDKLLSLRTLILDLNKNHEISDLAINKINNYFKNLNII